MSTDAFERAWDEAMERALREYDEENKLLASAASGGPFWRTAEPAAASQVDEELERVLSAPLSHPLLDVLKRYQKRHGP